MTKQKLLMHLVGEATERLACKYGDDKNEYNTMYRDEAKEILAMVKACKVGNRYYTHNLVCISAIFQEVGARIEDAALPYATEALRLCNEYLVRVNPELAK